MSTYRFSSLDFSSTIHLAGSYSQGNSDVIEFDVGLSAADARLVRTADFSGLVLSAQGRVCRLLGSGGDPADLKLQDLATSQFLFDDGSKLVFANRFNGYDASLSGGQGDDLLIGSQKAIGLTLVSATRAGRDSDGSSGGGSLSADGRYVVFSSTSNDLAPGDTKGFSSDLFMRDLATGKVTLLSATDGTAWPGDSFTPRVSADGRTIAFTSRSINAGDAGGPTVVMVLDNIGTATPTLRVVNLGTQGEPPDDASRYAALSADGQHVAYRSSATNLVDHDTNNRADVFYRDLAPGSATVLVSVGLNGEQANAASGRVSVSGDGRFVAFESSASNLVAGDTNGFDDIFLRDTSTNTTTLVSRGSGVNIGARNLSSNPAISDDGKYVAFESFGKFGYQNTPTDTINVFVCDVSDPDNPVVKVVSADSRNVVRGSDFDGATTAGGYEGARVGISGNGRYVVFFSRSPLLVSDDTDAKEDVFVKDMVSGRIDRLRTDEDERIQDAHYTAPSISDDGSRISFARTTDPLTTSAHWQTYVIDNPLNFATLRGGNGDDTYQISRLIDVIHESRNGGTDTVVSTVLRYQLGSHLENLELGGSGNLTAIGNSGNNVLRGNVGNNVLDGGAGTDTASYARAVDAVTVTLSTPGKAQDTVHEGRDTLISIENLTGSAFGDTLVGDNAANVLDGGAGRDVLRGRSGNDRYLVDDARDRVVEKFNCGTDTIYSTVSFALPTNVERLVLQGRAGLDGSGNTGNESLRGNAGDNRLDGKGGSDRLTGGGGRDEFVLASLQGSDTIVDFAAGVDRILVRGEVLSHLGNGDTTIDGALERAAPGGFAPTAELVLFTHALAGAPTASQAAAAIGSAQGAYESGDRALFVLNDGQATSIFLFTSSGHDGAVSAGELTLLATLQGALSGLGDYLFG